LNHPAHRFAAGVGSKVIFDGDLQMALAQQIASAKVGVRSRDMTIILGYSIFALGMLLAIYLAGSPPGTEAADFANMVAFS
jgi:hypothetical protein